jgi:hypothetical protein
MRWAKWMSEKSVRRAIARTVIAVVSLAVIATVTLIVVKDSGDQSAQTTFPQAN